jgi:hypothetical protein
VDRNTRLRRNPDVVARPLAEGEGGVLLHLDSGAYHRFNPIGLAIWDLLEGDRLVSDLAEDLRGRVQDPPASLDDDVLAFCSAAVERDLVQIVD